MRCCSTSLRSFAPPPSTSRLRPTGRRPGCAPPAPSAAPLLPSPPPSRRLPASHLPTPNTLRPHLFPASQPLPASVPSMLSLLLRPTWCGAGAADHCASEAFELHGGRPSGLCPIPSANPNPNPTLTLALAENPTGHVPLQSCVRDIHDIHVGAWINSLQAVRKKYAKPEFGFISNIPPLTSTV